MPVPDRTGKPGTKNSIQNNINWSFDEEFNVIGFELLAFDSITNVLRRVTIDGLAHFGTNNIDKASSTTIYEGLEDANEVWQVVKIETVGNITTNTYATNLNNSTVTNYADAWSGRTTLTFGTYGEAF